MKKEIFIEKLAESMFETETKLDPDTILEDLEGWDSLGRLGITALFYELFKIKVDTKTLKACKTVSDIIVLTEGNLEE